MLILGKTDKKFNKLNFFNFIVVIFELLTLGVLVQCFKYFYGYFSRFKTLFLKELSNFFEDDQNLLIFLVFLFFLIYLLKSILLILFYSKQFQFTYDLKAKFTSNVFSHYIYSPYSFHLNNSSHELIRNVGNEVSLVATGIIHQLIIIGTELLIIGSIIIFLIIQKSKIILTLLLFFLIIGILYYLSTSKKIRDLGHLRQTVTTDIVKKKTINSLYGIKDIKILGKEDYFSKLYKNSAYELSRFE